MQTTDLDYLMPNEDEFYSIKSTVEVLLDDELRREFSSRRTSQISDAIVKTQPPVYFIRINRIIMSDCITTGHTCTFYWSIQC